MDTGSSPSGSCRDSSPRRDRTGCWWHPWWGYVCTSFQDTRTFDGLAYELGLGVRYDFNDVLAADGSYRMKWVDYSNATDTPSFDGFQLNLIWKF